jgi:hypothetical protein
MGGSSGQHKGILSLLIALLIGVQAVAAASFLKFGASPFQPLLNFIASAGNLVIANNTMYVALMRILLGVAIFAVSHYVFRVMSFWRDSAKDGNPALGKNLSITLAAIVALGFGLFMPAGILLNLWSIAAALILPIFIAGYAVYRTKGKDSEGNERKIPFWGHLIALIAIMTAMFLLMIWFNPDTGTLTGKLQAVSGEPRAVIEEILGGEFLIIMILMLVPFGRMILQGGSAVWDKVGDRITGRTTPSGAETELEGRAPPTTAPKIPHPLPRPRNPQGLKIALIGPNKAKAAWDPSPAEQEVVTYDIELKYNDMSITEGAFWKNPTGWQTLQHGLTSPEHEFLIDPKREVLIRVRCWNKYGQESGWSKLGPVVLEKTPTVTPPPPTTPPPPIVPPTDPPITPPPTTTPTEVPEDLKELYKKFTEAETAAEGGLGKVKEALMEVGRARSPIALLGEGVPLLSPTSIDAANKARAKFKEVFLSYMGGELHNYVEATNKVLKHEAFSALLAEEQDAVVNAATERLHERYGELRKIMFQYKNMGALPGEVL